MSESVQKISIHQILPDKFLDYSKSVLQERAIPSGFDGLKPVQRRVLMSYYDLKLFSSTPYKKSVKVVGECLGSYHAHGDKSVYDALVALAQDFNMRYPLVDGSGNYGSVNGEAAAQMRYTESKLSPYGELMLDNVKKLAEMKPNFDGSGLEPINLASFFPNLLLNGVSGIAVGMATKFPPHYAKDVYDALLKAINCEIKGEKITEDTLIDIIKGPDFPTGAIIVNGKDMKNIYKTGKGNIVLRAKYHIEKKSIIYTELPYKITQDKIIQAVAALNISDIKDIRDESSLTNGVRIVVDLKNDSDPEIIVNRLFKETPLQSNFSVNMVAIIDNKPDDNINLKKLILYYLKNLSLVHYKDLNNQLNELREKTFTLNCMIKAIENLNKIADILKESDDPIQTMINVIGFSQEEAEYVFNCRLSSLSKASKKDLEEKLDKNKNDILKIENILKDQKNFLKNLAEKVKAIRDSKLFKNDKRRTEITSIELTKALNIKNLIKNESILITYSNKNTIKAIRSSSDGINKRSGCGEKLKTLRENEYICDILTSNTHSNLLLFSSLGYCYLLPVNKLSIGTRTSPSQSIFNFIKLADNEEILGISNAAKDLSVVLVTKLGFIKRLNLSDLNTSCIRSAKSKIITLTENDIVKSADICASDTEIVIFTDQGRGLKLNIDDETKPVRPMGKTAKGTAAIKLKKDEVVAGASVIDKNHFIVLITENGFGKRLDNKLFKNQKRNQSPVNYIGKNTDIGKVINALSVTSDEKILITTQKNENVFINISHLLSGTKTSAPIKIANSENILIKAISIKKNEEKNDE